MKICNECLEEHDGHDDVCEWCINEGYGAETSGC